MSSSSGMVYRGHKTLRGDANWGKEVVVVYAEPRVGQPWRDMDPALLDGAPKSFNAAKEGAPPDFKRDYWIVSIWQMRFDVLVYEGRKTLVLQAYPAKGVDPLVSMRRLNNLVLTLAQQTGFTQWCVCQRDLDKTPFTLEPTNTDELPAPVDRKMIQLANEGDLRTLKP